MKKILIISEYFAPVQEIASIRWTKIAKYLKSGHDVEITVLTNKKNYFDKKLEIPISRKDILLEKELVMIDKVLEGDYGKLCILYYKIRNKLKGTEKNDKKMTEKRNDEMKKGKECFRDILSFWNNIIKDFIMTRQVMKMVSKSFFDFDVIISTCGPAWTHRIAEKLKKRNPKVFWIADFRDPYAKDDDGFFSFHYHKNFVSKHCRNADVITRVNDKMQLFEKEGQRVVTIHNGYDPEEALSPVSPDKFRMVYTGFLYDGKRKLNPVFLAVKDLIKEGKIAQEDILFEYAGSSEMTFMDQAVQCGMQGQVEKHGVVERKKALEMQRKSAVLLQSAWNTKLERVEWTGKMYEYMMAGKPIVYMVSGDEPYSLPSKLMPKLGGVCYEECRHDETFPALKQYILGKYQEWKKTGNVTIQADKEYIRKFAYPQIAEKVWDLMKDNN